MSPRTKPQYWEAPNIIFDDPAFTALESDSQIAYFRLLKVFGQMWPQCQDGVACLSNLTLCWAANRKRIDAAMAVLRRIERAKFIEIDLIEKPAEFARWIAKEGRRGGARHADKPGDGALVAGVVAGVVTPVITIRNYLKSQRSDVPLSSPSSPHLTSPGKKDIMDGAEGKREEQSRPSASAPEEINGKGTERRRAPGTPSVQWPRDLPKLPRDSYVEYCDWHRDQGYPGHPDELLASAIGYQRRKSNKLHEFKPTWGEPLKGLLRRYAERKEARASQGRDDLARACASPTSEAR